MYRRFLLVTGVAFAGLLVAGCASSSKTASSATTASSGGSSGGSKPTAESVVNQFKAAGLPVGEVQVFTAATDPNNLLGRPNGYSSKAAFVDTRTGETLASGTGVSQGGSVETFDSEADAKARAKNIQTLLKATQILGSEYNYVSPGGVLVRISGKLTPDEADAYGKAAGATLYKA